MSNFRNTSLAAWFSHNSRPILATLPVAALLIAGCGGHSGSGVTPPPGVAPTITTQPASTTIPLNSSASLSVTAAGTGPLAYQWSENSNALSGETSATLTTSALQLSDSGDKFTVTISNAYGSITSSAAVITIGPRAPAQRDMRFKHVQIASSLQQTLVTDITAEIPGNMTGSQTPDDLGVPLMVGNQTCGTIANLSSCGWSLSVFAPPAGVPGFNSSYGVDLLTNLTTDLNSTGANSVITSLDEHAEPGLAYDIFAYSLETDPTVSNGFTLQQAQVTDATLNDTATAMAQKGVVITAASVNSSGKIDLFGYSWSGDAGTTYDAQTLLTNYVNAGPQALTLAQQGYIITAVGTADANQILLVGTKVHGDTLPRNLSYASQGDGGGTSSPGQIVVGYTFGNDAGNNPNLPANSTLLAQ